MEVTTPGPIIVTGAASGIGRAVALQLAADGVAVGLIDSDGDELVRLGREMTEQLDAKAAVAVADVSNELEVASAFGAVETSVGSTPVGFVLNVGIEVSSPLASMPTETWRRVLATNLDGAFFTLRSVLQILERADSQGSIVLVGSPAARTAYSRVPNAAYAASKAGVEALARCAAVEVARAGIRVNVVVPGATRTRLLADPSSTDINDLAAAIPMRRIAEPVEPAAAIVWLLSDAASYVTGSRLVCDGGLLAVSPIPG